MSPAPLHGPDRALTVHDAPRARVHFLPNAAAIYRERVATLQDSLSAAGGTSGAASALRALIEKIVLTPAPNAPDGLHVELHGALAPILALAAGGPATRRIACSGAGAEPGTSVPGGLLSVVAGTGFEPVTFRL